MSDGGGFIDPMAEQFSVFAKHPIEGKVWMLNLIALRDEAAYADGREGTGREAYQTYGRESAPFFAAVGGQIILSGAPLAALIGPAHEAWDIAFIAEYPSQAAFIDMIKNPGYQAIVFHRQAALRDSRLIPIRPGGGKTVFG